MSLCDGATRVRRGWSLGALLWLPLVLASGGSAATGPQAALVGAESEYVAQAPTQPRASPAGRGAPLYLPASELDTRPQIMTQVLPVYPPELVAGIRGVVVLELYIAQDGKLDRIRVARAEPPGRFEESALTAFSKARFSPGMKKGRRVPSLVRIEVTYGD